MDPLKIVVLGDVGGAGGYHLGDEAMAEALVEGLAARRPLEVTAVTGDAADTERRYGWGTVARIGFASGDGAAEAAERASRAERVLAGAEGDTNALAWDDPAWDVIHAVAAADLVVVSGAGNLNSAWPEHIAERAALGALAARFSKRLVVSGQMLGPTLTETDGVTLAGLVNGAALLSVRDRASRDLASELGAPRSRTSFLVDDAMFLAPTKSQVPLPESGYVLATFAAHSGDAPWETVSGGYATLLRTILRESQLSVLLLAHHGTDGEDPTGDYLVHRRLAEELDDPRVVELGPTTAREAMDLTRTAAAVVSSRYHPVVFATGTAVPVLGIGVDHYTQSKIRGALENVGLADYALGVGSLVHGDLTPVVRQLLDDGPQIRDHLRAVSEVRREELGRWWDLVIATAALPLGAEPGPAVSLSDVPELHADPAWAAEARGLADWSALISRHGENSRRASAEALRPVLADALHAADRERETLVLRDELRDVRLALDEARTEIEIANREGEHLMEAALEAAERRLVDAEAELDLARSEIAALHRSRAELDALMRTRSMRALRLPRRVYSRVRFVLRGARDV
ncbi:polysaccharide pyruvyl transferase family protein [Miniimonas sp. S16]|uniref:polysaccharide pyruvyl transferase family protein n=1 Tax=Miniimonas sp. S16 TaxID=2171623 RepID=UPI000D526688|nr:polysaccharide pyruvyl transferase family protein [Miniimonas sp. S16]